MQLRVSRSKCLKLILYSLGIGALGTAWAQSQDGAVSGQPAADRAIAPAPKQPDAAASGEQQDKRVFGVFPNYRTTDANVPFQRIDFRQKLIIGLKDSFDWPVYPVAGAFAAIYQLEDQNPSFGQGMTGYARRYGTALGDQVIGNMMTETIYPSLLHQDPRYFRIGQSGGSVRHRLVYALSRILICRSDRGGRQFNYSEFLGNATTVAISNAYYPDTRTASDGVERLGVALGTDAVSQVMKEFWPDVKRALFHRHEDGNQALLSKP